MKIARHFLDSKTSPYLTPIFLHNGILSQLILFLRIIGPKQLKIPIINNIAILINSIFLYLFYICCMCHHGILMIQR